MKFATVLQYAIYGASGCGRGVQPLARAQCERLGPPYQLVFVDDAPPSVTVNCHRVLTYAQWLNEPAAQRFINIAIASGEVREGLVQRFSGDGVTFFEVRSENVVELDNVLIGEGAVLCPFVTITSNIQIGRHIHANLYSYEEHDCVIGDFVTFAPGVKCNGNVVVDDHAYIGAAAILRQGKPGEPLLIGRGAALGMGAVVTKPVPPGVTVVGDPALSLQR